MKNSRSTPPASPETGAQNIRAWMDLHGRAPRTTTEPTLAQSLADLRGRHPDILERYGLAAS